jgi:YD repeat-containing protein
VTPLKGIVDENGNRFATWTYDQVFNYPQATSFQHAGGADLTKVAYDSNFNPTVTTALGEQDFYSAVGLIQEIDRLGTSAVRKFTYDTNGYVASQTDWDGNLTTIVNNARGLPKSITEAAGTPLARTTSTTWLSTFHLPVQITEPNRTTAFTYDANGNMLTKTITAGIHNRVGLDVVVPIGQGPGRARLRQPEIEIARALPTALAVRKELDHLSIRASGIDLGRKGDGQI